MNNSTHDHFNCISDKYQEAAKSWDIIYKCAGSSLKPLVKDAVVLDVGNGGRFAYDPDSCRKVIAMDISPRMLENIDDDKVVKVVGDARDMEGIEEECVDVIVFILSLHHINGNSVQESLKILDQVLNAAREKLRIGGHLVIAEGLLPKPVYSLQAWLFKVEQYILRRLGAPMVFFYSRKILTAHIAKSFGIHPREVEEIPIRLEEWIDPFGGSFPGLIKLPPWLSPYDFRVLIAERKM